MERMRAFCELNDLPVQVMFSAAADDWRLGTCAYWRPDGIHIAVSKCAWPGLGGRAWSWPGYVIDRTPFGVIAHEMGHAADHGKSTRRGNYYGDYSMRMRERTGEKPITTYAPNDAEWFAEIFRLFITNPDLLYCLRPKTHQALMADFKPVETNSWEIVLTGWGAPARTIDMARKKIAAAK